MTHTDRAFRWTEENTAEAKRLWLEKGWSASMIADRLGATKSAVIGRMNRMGIVKRVQGISAAPKEKPANYRAHRTLEGARADRATIYKLRRPKIQATETTMLPDEAPADLIGIMDLTLTTCRWPIGEVGKPGFGYCGHETAEGKSYCPSHRKRAFNRPGQAREAA